MNYVWWVVGLIVLVAAGYYLWVNAPGTAELDSQGAAVEQSISRQGSGSFAELAALGGSFECNVSMDVGGSSSEGTMYIADEQVRADFSSTVAGQSFTSHMVQSEGYVYTWSDLVGQGYKIPVATSGPSDVTTLPEGTFDPSAAVQYDCQPWAADASVFVVPTDIIFTEVPAAQ